MARFIERDPLAVLPDSGVGAGSFTNSNITVNSQGIVTAASDGSGGVSNFNDLGDVDLAGLATDQFVRFNGVDWAPHTLIISDADDVDVVSPTLGEILVFDGTDWANSSLSAAGVLTPADIGVTVQAWDLDLDALAALSGTGIVVHTGPGTFAERSLQEGEGIVITNDDGVSGDPVINLDINGLPTFTTVEEDEDFIAFYNTDLGIHQKILVEDFYTQTAPVADIVTVGVGAATFKGFSGTTAEFRSIDNANNGIVVTLSGTDTIEIGVSANLENLGLLTPTLDNFIVGTGAAWASETPANARTSLGLGTMALEDANDYLELTGDIMLGNIDMGGTNFIINLADPINPQDAATKAYVDGEVLDVIGGDGLVETVGVSTITLDVGAGTGIIVNTDDVELDVGFTDGRYHTQTVLASTTGGSEGADLIGTNTKTNLGNSDTVEDALTYLDTNFPSSRFRQDISVWNLDITTPSASRATVSDIEVARFNNTDDSAIYRDIMLPPDFDNTQDFSLYISLAKTSAAAGVIRVEAASQIQAGGSFTVDGTLSFDLGSVTTLGTLTFTISTSGFSTLDVITLRLRRLANTDAGDTFGDTVDFFGAFITQ